MPMQQLVILADDSAAAPGSMAVIAPRKELLETLSHYNTAPAREGEDVLYGPGFRIELAPEQDPVTQMLMTIDDDDIAWVAIMHIARSLNWKLLDPMTGRELRPRDNNAKATET
jgi:hypothetical protein